MSTLDWPSPRPSKRRRYARRRIARTRGRSLDAKRLFEVALFVVCGHDDENAAPGAKVKLGTERRRGRRVDFPACSQVYGGPQSAHITGTIDGQGVNLTVTRTDGCGTADWQTLEPLLGDPQRSDIPNATIAPATTSTVPPVTYKVKRGDTLTVLARRFGVSIAAIVAINHLANPDHLAEGQRLVIPRSRRSDS